LLHAFGPNGKYSWRKQINTLSKDYKIIIPNLIYFGNSTKKTKNYHVQEQVKAVTILLNHLKINSFILGGTSYGGVIAFELFHQKNFSIKKLFLINSPVKYVFEEGWQKTIKDFGVNKKSDVLIPDNHLKLKKLYDLINFKKKPFPKFVFKDILNTLYTFQATERKLLIDAFKEDQKVLKTRTYETNIPILLIWGKEDILCPLKTAIKLKEHLGEKARLEVIPKARHMPHIERKKQVNKILSNFVSS